MDTGDDKDAKLNFKDNLTFYVYSDSETGGAASGVKLMGDFEGFYIDDPSNPVIVTEGAKALALGAASALVLATLA